MYAVFDKTLETGNELIDSQHKELIDRINSLIRSCEEGEDAAEAVKMMEFLTDYTDFHFSAEEALQEKMGYAGISYHKKQHQDFIETVANLKAKLEAEGPTKEFADLVNKDVTEWLYGHIKIYDRAVADYNVYLNCTNHPEKMG